MLSKCSAMFLQCSAMFDIFMKEQPGGGKVKIAEIYNDVINENLDYEFKAELNPENPMKWAKNYSWISAISGWLRPFLCSL